MQAIQGFRKRILSYRITGSGNENGKACVMNNRSHTFAERNTKECNLENQYDLVIGPVANDDMALLFRQFEDGFITIETLTREMTYKQLTNQYSFHTERAIQFLQKAGIVK